MQLVLQSQVQEHVVIIRCQGRLVSGDEIRALELEVDKVIHFKKRIVLQLAEVAYIDSAGLGSLVRLFSVLRVDGGGLKLCQVSAAVLKVLQITKLHAVIPIYETEKEATAAFFRRPEPREKASRPVTSIICIDKSADLLAYLNALLTQAGYEVFTTRHFNDARILVNVIGPRIVIYGTGSHTSEAVIEKIRQTAPHTQILALPHDFSIAEASQAGSDLLGRVRSTLAAHA